SPGSNRVASRRPPDCHPQRSGPARHRLATTPTPLTGRPSELGTAETGTFLRSTARSVQAYPSSPPSFLGFEAARLDEGVQRARRDLQDLGDRRLGTPLAQQHLNLALFPIELRRAEGALRATE